ncbi:hypothetical protein [Leptolyngbya sp. NIES-2104]|uniref:hypothetical protein n=1 Tax=Leptolyngbya sp. NIES-2104 TaxID=1552121 RepID=UPI0006EC7AD8|nr:hypothetical protein [Leptolyngbya sp. NIES-2104]GAP99739.1 hypothetical protein NIES2104_63050 [Leptolyngbya sp. NIES-2104]
MSYSGDRYSPNLSINDTIVWLLDHGYPPLPIAPYQDPHQYPKLPIIPNTEPLPRFTGKNPSYLNFNGQPCLIKHQDFQHRLPSSSKIKRWFCDWRTGIATMGGWNNTVWLDFDVHRFQSIEDCWTILQAYLEFAPCLKSTFIEISQSQGWHLGVRCNPLPDFSNFAFQPEGFQAGELIGEGKIIVLAPTQGKSGQYQSIQRVMPIQIESLDSISIFARTQPTGASLLKAIAPSTSSVSSTDRPIAIEHLVCQRVRFLLQQLNEIPVGQRSDTLCTIAREVFGWENWLQNYPYCLAPSADIFCQTVGQQLGLDAARIQRILNSQSHNVSIRYSMPAIHRHLGDAGCDRQVQQAVRFSYSLYRGRFS